MYDEFINVPQPVAVFRCMTSTLTLLCRPSTFSLSIVIKYEGQVVLTNEVKFKFNTLKKQQKNPFSYSLDFVSWDFHQELLQFSIVQYLLFALAAHFPTATRIPSEI